MGQGFQLRKGVGGALIVGGTAIGAGMLAQPVVTAEGGFLPAVVMYLLCWLFSMATGLLFLEICAWMPEGANLVSMSKTFLGPVGKWVAWLLYLFLFYTLTIAYVAAGGDFAQVFFGEWMPYPVATMLFTLVFASFVYAGTKFVDRINLFLIVGLIASYLAFLVIGAENIEIARLKPVNWGAAVLALPVLFTAFSYQGTLPSLYSYLEKNRKAMRFAIVFGSSIPFLAYLLWEFFILGIVPLEGPHGLLSVAKSSGTAVEPLRYLFPKSPIFVVGQFFSMFAVITSFLGVTLGLLDFLADGLSVEKTRLNTLWLCLGIFVPCVLVASINRHIFLIALSYAGGIGCATLLGLFPVMMVWVGRYRMNKTQGEQELRGGKAALVALAAFVIFELCVQAVRSYG